MKILLIVDNILLVVVDIIFVLLNVVVEKQMKMIWMKLHVYFVEKKKLQAIICFTFY